MGHNALLDQRETTHASQWDLAVIIFYFYNQDSGRHGAYALF